jgi:hypothetical protein
MKTAHNSHRGQALVIFVFALIGLIGMTGLAIDSGMVFSDRRHAQNAADTAALAGALVKVEGHKGNHWTNADCVTAGSGPCKTAVVRAALDRAASNGYTSNLTDNTVQVNIPPISGPYADCNNYSFNCQDYIQVIIDSNVNTFFAKVLGIPQMHNQVEAVTLAKYEPSHLLYGGNSLVQLKPGGNCSSAGDFVLSGSGLVKLIGGGIWINSDCPVAYTEGSNCIDLQLLPSPGTNISIVGGNAGSSCSLPRPFQPVTEQYQFPPEDLLPEPPECRMSGHANPTGPDGAGLTHFYPGYYPGTSFPPDRNSYLEPGIYCVEQVVKLTGNNASITGSNVLIWIKEGGYFSLQQGTISLSGRTDPNDPYYGFLIYVDSDYLPSWGIENCTINGGATGTFTGVIYAPDCNVSVEGTSNSSGFTSQIIAYELKLSGTNQLIFTYDQQISPHTPEIMDTGLFR